jgi:Putative transposase
LCINGLALLESGKYDEAFSFTDHIQESGRMRTASFSLPASLGELEGLTRPAQFNRLLKKARKKKWVVYAKRPFGGPQQVLDYLGRYTHRVAISNNRLLGLEDRKVRFSWKDYRDSDKTKEMTLEAEEFIRRFLMHVLPDGFQKIRYFGFMANRRRAANLALCRSLIGDTGAPVSTVGVKDWKERYRELTGEDVQLGGERHSKARSRRPFRNPIPTVG